MKAWHFLKSDRRLQYDDNREVLPHRTYTTPNVHKPIELCIYGMHGSIDPLNALDYASGPIVCRVEITGEIETTYDKIAGRRRKVLWMYDATKVLRDLACEVALSASYKIPNTIKCALQQKLIDRQCASGGIVTYLKKRCLLYRSIPRVAAAISLVRSALDPDLTPSEAAFRTLYLAAHVRKHERQTCYPDFTKESNILRRALLHGWSKRKTP